MLDTTTISWQCIPFVQLTAQQVHAIYTLRAAVFVVEQNCAYQDPDEKDLLAIHVLGWYEDKLVACARILPAGVSYAEVSIGRVATS
ncbi:MAG: GNAT family N-acetyltransferase, partial [Bacteroidia bacterium]